MGEGKKRALVVGINEYEDQDGFGKLKYAESDAQAIYEKILIDQDVGGFDPKDVVLFIPKSEKPEITKAEIEESLGNMLSESKEEDLVFIYFSGHGKLDKSNKLCLAVRKTKIKNLVATSIHIDNIKNMIHNSNCKRIVLIIDSCYSGAAGPITLKSEAEQPELAGSLKPISGEGRIVIAASQPLQKSGESEDMEHGIFTHYLLKGLKDGEADDGNDSDVYAHELFNYISREVGSATRGQQMPIMWGNGGIVIAKSSKNKKKGDIGGFLIEARDLVNKGELRQALNTFDSVIELDPDNKEALQRIQQIKDVFTTRAKLVGLYIPLLEREKESLTEEEKFFMRIYDTALKLFGKLLSNLNGGEKRRAGSVGAFLRGDLSLASFKTTWEVMEAQDTGQKDQVQPDQPAEKKGTIGAGGIKVDDTGPRKISTPNDPKKPEAPETNEETLQPGVIKVFFSYAREDEKLKEKLDNHLSGLKQEGKIRGWHDRQILPGEIWEDEIKQHLKSAHVILFLISSDFMASVYCNEVEVKEAMKRHDAGEARVIPIVLRDLDWDTTVFAKKKIQALPKDAKAVTLWQNEDEAFKNVAVGIRRVVEELSKKPVKT